MLLRNKFFFFAVIGFLQAQEIWFFHKQKPSRVFLDSEKIITKKNKILIRNFYLKDLEEKYPNLAYLLPHEKEILYLIFYQNQLIDIAVLKANENPVDAVFQAKESTKIYQNALFVKNPKEALSFAYLATKSQNLKQAYFWLSKAQDLDSETKKAFQKLLLQN